MAVYGYEDCKSKVEVPTKEEFDNLTAEDVGAIPIIEARSADYDMDVILNTSNTNGFYITDSLTLNTPYNKGVTGWADSTIYSYTNATNYGYQVAYMAGSIPMMRTLINGTISEWTTGFLPLSGGTLSGELLLNGGYSRLVSGQNQIQIEARDVIGNTNNRRLFLLNTATGHPNIYNALMINNIVNGSGTSYKIYGEHNITCGTSAPTSSLTTGCIYQQYE